MSIGLLLKAELKSSLPGRMAGGGKTPEEILRQMGEWVEQFCADLCATSYLGSRDDRPTLYCRLHPAAEDLELSFVDSSLLIASANTSTVGPGYHIFVCDMLHRLAREFPAAWQEPTDDHFDETGYFHSGERERVFEEMTLWLRAVANSFFDGSLETSASAVRLALPMDLGFEWDVKAITPLGPRDINWLKKTADDGLNGCDFFAWWTPGLNAEYFLGRAQASMWADVRWRAPSNDFERKTLSYVTNSLETAFKLDPSLNYPWAEWAAILDLLDAQGDDHDFVRERARGLESKIGYRRRNVTVRLPGNWWIRIPGSFGEFLPEGDAFCAQDPPRAIWYTAYVFTGDVEESFAHWRSEVRKMAKDFFEESGDYIATARIKLNEENGHEYFALASSNVCPTGRCICTIAFDRPEERDWAISVCRSLQPPKGRQAPPDR